MMSKPPKHRGSSHSWDEDDDPAPAAEPAPSAPSASVASVSAEPKHANLVMVKCISVLHPWADLRYLEMNEETEVSPEAAQILADKGFVELLEEIPPPPGK